MQWTLGVLQRKPRGLDTLLLERLDCVLASQLFWPPADLGAQLPGIALPQIKPLQFLGGEAQLEPVEAVEAEADSEDEHHKALVAAEELSCPTQSMRLL